MGAAEFVDGFVRQPGRGLEETSREEAILVSDGGLVTVTGGKLTTHRRMGEKALDRAAPLLERQGVAVPRSATRGRPFPGKPPSAMSEFLQALAGSVAPSNPGLADSTVAHLGRRYGRRASEVIGLALEDRALTRPLCRGLPDIDAEVVFAARAEDARSLSDVFIRRTHVFWQAVGQGMESIERAADLLARELEWTADQRRVSMDEYAREVTRSRQCLGAEVR